MSKPNRPTRPRRANHLRTLDNRALTAVAGGEVPRARVYFKSGASPDYGYSELLLIESHTDG